MVHRSKRNYIQKHDLGLTHWLPNDWSPNGSQQWFLRAGQTLKSKRPLELGQAACVQVSHRSNVADTKHSAMTPPYLLAIETSGSSSAVALATSSRDRQLCIVAEHQLDPANRTARALIPHIERLLTEAKIGAADLGAVVVAVGPGSFTGLRIGITAAKTIAYATGANLVGVNTLDVLARQAGNVASGRVWAALDAQRGDVFAAWYNETHRQLLGETDRTQLLAGEAWLQDLGSGDLVIGPVVQHYGDHLPDGVRTASAEICTPRPSAVADLGFELLERGQTADPFQLVPQYHRLSAAEEKARSKRS